MTENTPEIPALVQEATGLLASAVTTMEFEIQGVINRHSLPKAHPDNLSTLAVDLFHTSALNMIGYVIGSYRLLLAAQSEGAPEVEHFSTELETFIHRFQEEMADETQRPRVGYLWHFLIIGLHHLLHDHFDYPLYQGDVPSLDRLIEEEKARRLWERAQQSTSSKSQMLN